MSEKRIDPRVIRTRKLLRDALLTQVPEKGFVNLTIQDITDAATLNRATFYLHYTDKNELLLDVFENLVTEAIPMPPDSFSLEDPPPRPIIAVFEHVAEYAGFYRIILGEEGVPFFMARVRTFIEELVLKWIMATQSIDTGMLMNPEIMVNYLASAHLGVVTWWLENDMPYSAEEMEQQLLILTRFSPKLPA